MFKDISNYLNLKIMRLLKKFMDKFECEWIICMMLVKFLDFNFINNLQLNNFFWKKDMILGSYNMS